MRISLFLLFIALCFNIKSQDIHFSQFWANPSHFNPGNTGLFDGKFRAFAIYRNQWGSISVPYQTYGVNFDGKEWINPGAVSIGSALYHDVSGDGALTNTLWNLSAAKLLNINDRNSFNLGLEFGMSQRSLQFNRLRFDNQFNGISYDQNLGNGETFGNNQFFNFNLNGGIVHLYTFNQNINIKSGISISNINGAKQKYFNNTITQIDRRINLSIEPEWKIDNKFTLLPATLYMLQGPFKQWVLGSNVAYTVNDQSVLNQQLILGAFYRTGDAVFATAGMIHNNWMMILSYDINTSRLNEASRMRGGFEISLRYLWKTNSIGKKQKAKICPVFI